MQEYFQEYMARIISGIGVSDVIDVLIVAFLIYQVFRFLRETRAEQLLKGLLILAGGAFLADYFDLYTLSFILRGAMTLGVIALVIVFQPELRRALEHVGRSKIMRGRLGHLNKEKAKGLTSCFMKAVDYLSAGKIGALIILERETALNDIVESGTLINAQASAELLENIFYKDAPLHDGAVLVRGDKIYAAGCVLPLTQNNLLDKDLGTRHRAGIGITENSDALAIIVSEETGIISIAEDGKLTRFLDIKTVEKTLLNIYFGNVEEKKIPSLKKLFGRNDNAPK